MKKDTHFFPHDYYARNDEKILCLMSIHGVVCYAIFWILVEILWENDTGVITHKYLQGTARIYNIDITLLESVITDCIKFELFYSDGEVFWSESVNRRKLERDNIRQRKSNAGKKGMESRWKDNTVITKDNSVITELNNKREIKSKETKSKETKVKEKKELNISFAEFWDLYDHKQDAKKCEQKWIALSDEERLQAMQHIPKYKISTPDKKYRKHPATYLNNKSFQNEIIDINGGQDAISKKSTTGNDGRGGKIDAFAAEAAKWNVGHPTNG